MNKTFISNFLRRIGILGLTDYLLYFFYKIKNHNINQKFKFENPNINLPPDYLIYESFQLNYYKYYNESYETAKWLLDNVSPFVKLENAKILDWGCGPGRIIRHLPNLLKSCEFYGTDYNKNSIKWCKNNLNNISFNHNNLDATLPYPDNYFNIIYGISIFTHLSKKKNYEWSDELYRILKPKGIFFFTTQGENFKKLLTINEKKKFDAGIIITRGNVKEGHRTYSTFHPEIFIRNLFNNFKILKHIILKQEKNQVIPQDIWIIEKI